MKRIIVIGNCTAPSIAMAMRKSSLFSEVTFELPYKRESGEFPAIFENLKRFDVIITLLHRQKYGELSSENIKSNFPEKTIVVAAPYFSGLFPDIVYLSSEGKKICAENVMSDYHSLVILEQVRRGLDKRAITESFHSGEAFECVNMKGVWADSLNEIRDREKYVDVKISDYICQRQSEKKLQDDFLTFNHPSEHLVNYIAQQCLIKLGLKTTKSHMLLADEHYLNMRSRIPIHHVVSEMFGIPYVEQIYWSASLGRSLSVGEFVDRSFAFFRDRCFELDVDSPWVVSKNLRER